jgi:2'-5' RNA ligase
MPTERLFVACELPPPVRAVLAALATPLPGVAWTRPEQMHLTLRFLGDVDTDRIGALREKLPAVRVAPFLLPVEGLGTFPPQRPPRVLWAGVGSGHPHLFQLRQRLDDALLAAGLDFDLRTFQPHITLARCAETAAGPVAHWLHLHRDFAAPPFRVGSFGLWSSELHAGGAVHELKQLFPLSN